MATILIVEDEEPVRELLGYILADAGHRAVLAIHGAEALELAAQDPPDLVLADVMMPVLDGAELCRRLKADPDTRAIPVILLSAAGRHVAQGTGADAFLAKPFDLEDLDALVRRWLRPRPAAGAPGSGA